MYINLQSLIKLPVFTQMGDKIGHVKDLEIDVELHSIRHYIVEQGLIGKDHFWVAPSQVISITAEKIIVHDAILSDPAFKETTADASKTAYGGVQPG